MPSTFAPAPGATVTLDLRIGDASLAQTLTRDPGHVRRFVVTGSDGVADVPGTRGEAPAGRIVVGDAGPRVVGYLSRPTWTILPGARFEEYLREVGLDGVVAERAARGESEEPGRERFTRCAKALVGGDGEAAWDTSLGFPLELRAETVADATGGGVTVRLRFKGRPLAGALVRAFSPMQADVAATCRTDVTGRARFPSLGSGPWVVAATHMVRLRHDHRADWASFWASLTVAGRQAGSRGPPPVPAPREPVASRASATAARRRARGTARRSGPGARSPSPTRRRTP